MEKDTQKLILDWLAAKRIWNMRLNTGAFKGSYKGKSRFVRFGRPGCADILAVKRWRQSDAGIDHLFTETFWIEVKGAKGVQSDEQKSFQLEVEQNQMHYILARDLEDVIKVMG